MTAAFDPTLIKSSKTRKSVQNRQIEVMSSRDPNYKLMIIIKGDMPKAMNKVMRSNRWTNYKDANRWKKLIGDAVQFLKPTKPLATFKIQAIRRSHRMLDYDGLVASLKPCIDALKDHVITDDRWSCTGPWEVNQEFKSKKDGSVLEITITELI